MSALIAKIPRSNLLTELLILTYVVLVFLWLDNFFAFERFRSIGVNVQGNFGLSEYIRQAVFVTEYTLAILAIYIASSTKKPWGLIFLLAAWILTDIDVVAHIIYGRPADLGNIAVLNASVANITDATQKYFDIIIISSAKTGILFFPLIIRSVFKKSTHSPRVLLTLFLVIAAIYGVIMIKRGAPALIGFPKGFSYGLGTAALSLNESIVSQNKIESNHTPDYSDLRKNFKNIVVVIDESIEYGELKRVIGNDELHKNILDFGRAFSGANCSAPSNYVIRKGFWERSDNDSLDIKEVDSLFKIAKRNGFSTAYIDNQGVLKDPTTRNYISTDEIQYIDKIIENDGPQYKRDLETIPQIFDLIGSGKNFILVNKIGAHFPYENTLDPSHVTKNNKENYYKSVRSNALEFLLKLASTTPSNTIIFYTSDHGQELNARGTHCNTADAISVREYSVPFKIVTGNSDFLRIMNERMPVLRDNLTHIDFSESIRNMLGEHIDNANSIFKYTPSSIEYCGLYGHPLRFFGALPSCKKLSAPIENNPES